MGTVIMASALLSARVAFGCEPSPFAAPPICERFWEEDAVALVDVQDITISGQTRRVTLRVVDVYRGSPPAELTIKDTITSCGAKFGRKARYLAWFSKTKNGKWTAYGELAEKVTDDLRFAQSMKNPHVTGRIYGTLDKPRHSLFVPDPIRPPELPDRNGVTLVAVSESSRYTAAVSRDLTFDFPALAPAKYEIHVEGLPENSDVDSRNIEVHGGGCNELILFSKSSASVSGRIVVAGELPHFGLVFLVDLASTENPRFSPWVVTNPETGAFEFKHVNPGKYVLGFELGHSPTLDAPYASRYFPEGTEEGKATVLEVHAGQEIKGIEFNLGEEVARRHVRVRVSWTDGSPAETATAYLRDAHDPYSSVAEKQTPTDANGEAILEGFVNTDYDVTANAVCKGRSISNKVETKVISASPKDAFVKLTTKGRKCSLVNWRPSEEDE
jgi:hypothetical protein